MCHLAVPGPDRRAKHYLRVGICPPTECPTACGIGKYLSCPDPTGEGGPWLDAPPSKKADFRKQVKKKAVGEKIMICENCLAEGRRSVYQGWNSSQHVKAKKNIGCTTDRNSFKKFAFFETYNGRRFFFMENFKKSWILKYFVDIPGKKFCESSFVFQDTFTARIVHRFLMLRLLFHQRGKTAEGIP